MFVILLIMYFFGSYSLPILNNVIKDDFVYKNQLVHEVEDLKMSTFAPGTFTSHFI